jgi:hypothetical protein
VNAPAILHRFCVVQNRTGHVSVPQAANARRQDNGM